MIKSEFPLDHTFETSAYGKALRLLIYPARAAIWRTSINRAGPVICARRKPY
ncbi:MAG: hypothetical protein ABF868_04460 [Sporolactobacillus sp.]